MFYFRPLGRCLCQQTFLYILSVSENTLAKNTPADVFTGQQQGREHPTPKDYISLFLPFSGSATGAVGVRN